MELFTAPMPVVALPCLVVIAKYALAIHYIGQSILERMPGARQWLRHLPQNEFGKPVWGIDNTLTKEFDSLSVGHNANTQQVLSIITTHKTKIGILASL